MLTDYLKKLCNNGFEAYIVGGYVRDYLLGKKSNDVDIITNATPEKTKEIFNIANKDNLGSLNFNENGYNIDITTYRKEQYYLKHRPTNIEYINDLELDLLRRDFTINTICMDKDLKIIDLLNGIKDLKKRKIKLVGDVETKFQEDPLRMLRAIRLAIILDFKINSKELKFILNNKHLFDTISFERKKIELNKILSSVNAIKGLRFIKKCKLEDALNIKIEDNIRFSSDIFGMWAQLDFDSRYPFTKKELKRINNIKLILKEKISKQTILKYEYEDVLAASYILDEEKFFRKTYRSMPVHSIQELQINGDDIKNICNIESSKNIQKIKENILIEVLEKRIENNKKSIKNYLKSIGSD